MIPTDRFRQAIGWLAVLGSAFCFYLATAVIRWAQPHVQIDAAYFVFGRFVLGFVVVCLTMLIWRQRLAPKNYHVLIGRTIANCIAVFCFYQGVQVSTLAEANILNMTHPLFVALFSWFFVKDQRDIGALAVAALACCGIWLLLSPGEFSSGWQNGWALASAVMAAIAMIYLNISRRYHDSQTILFFMFGLGSLAMLLLCNDSIFLPGKTAFFFLFACSAAGVLGQYLLTYGFLYVTAVEGSVISSTRILLAALLGPFLVGDPFLTLTGWCGAFLIFTADTILAFRKTRT